MSNNFSISASGLSKCYTIDRGLFHKNTQFLALNNISFTLLEGETLGVLGESGAGKSTLAKLLVGEEIASSGLLLIDNKDVTHLNIHKRLIEHRKIRMVYQDPYASLNPSLTIIELLDEPLKNITKLNKSERKSRIIEVLNLVGLKSEHGRRLPHMFSPGERQRIAIARALILDPICIVLDEPLSALDISVQSQIINLMLELQENLKLSFILISYNLPVLWHMCDKLMVLCRGQIVEYGPTISIIDNPQHPYTKDILTNSSHSQNNIQVTDASFCGCVYSDRCENALDICSTKQPEQSIIDEQIVYCHKFASINTEEDGLC